MASLRATALLATALTVSAYQVAPLRQTQRQACLTVDVQRTTPTQMLNLFGNSEESKQRRTALSYRSAQPGDRKVTFRKPNAATQGIMLGLKFRENFQKAVFIDKIVEGSEAARLKREGKIREGDEITMVSATFGDEMWSARGVGKYRLEKSIAVRQGMTISFVVENRSDKDMKKRAALDKEAQKERDRVNRLQQQLQNEVDQEKKKGWSIFG